MVKAVGPVEWGLNPALVLVNEAVSGKSLKISKLHLFFCKIKKIESTRINCSIFKIIMRYLYLHLSISFRGTGSVFTNSVFLGKFIECNYSE